MQVFACKNTFIITEKNSNSLDNLNKNSSICSQSTSGLDQCFNSTGKVSLNSNFNIDLNKIIYSNGYIYHIGNHYDLNSSKAYLVVQKSSLDGELDLTYGVSGLSETPEFDPLFTPSVFFIDKAIVDADENLYIVIHYHDSFDYKGFIVKYKPDGTLDTNFNDGTSCASNGGGCIQLNEVGMSYYEWFEDLYILNSNLYAIYYIEDLNNYYQIRKYNLVTGQLTNDFGQLSSGIATFQDAGKDYRGKFFYFDTVNSHIYVVGNFHDAGQTQDLFIHKIDLISGDLDLTYGTSGLKLLPQPTDMDLTSADMLGIKFFDNGDAVAFVVGSGIDSHYYLHKFNFQDGVNDSTFDLDGYKVIDEISPDSVFSNSQISNFLVLDDSFYFCGKSTISFQQIFSMAKLDFNGDLDTSFEENGFYYPNLSLYGHCDHMILTPENSIFATGTISGAGYLYKFIP